MCSDERNETGDHDGNAKDRKLFANVQKRFALLGSLEVAGVTDGADNQSHEQSVQAGIKDHVAEDDAQGLHAGVDGLRKTEICVCFHCQIFR